jgi:hypothetical protein
LIAQVFSKQRERAVLTLAISLRGTKKALNKYVTQAEAGVQALENTGFRLSPESRIRTCQYSRRHRDGIRETLIYAVLSFWRRPEPS